MDKIKIIETLKANPVICAVKDVDELEKALVAPAEIIFLLVGDINNLPEILQKIKAANKLSFIHLDLIKGFDNDSASIQYMINLFEFSGLISTKTSLLRTAKSQGVFVIQRLFMVDSNAYSSSIHAAKELKPDAVEIMPGILPKVIQKAYKELNIPIIAGGLIDEKEEVISCLKSGATCVSTTKNELWYV